MENRNIFWDKKLSNSEIKQIIKDDSHPRFIEFVAILLSNTNDPSVVFGEYLNKKTFVTHWRAIKNKMRKNRWNDSRIIYWDEFYRFIRKEMDVEPNIRKKEPKDGVLASIGKTFCEERKKKGLSQKELAAKTSLSQQTISFVERGLINISFQTLKKIADALGMAVKVSVQKRENIKTTDMTSSSSMY